MEGAETFSPEKLKKVLTSSYSPFSNFKVAAAVKSSSGKFYYGCNVENSTYGATICAERTALVKMVSEEGPEVKILEVYVLTETDEPVTPCGICRQSLFEFLTPGTDIPVKSYSKGLKIEKVYSLSELIPEGFRL